MVFDRNCAKGPKPTMPIFRFLEGADSEDEIDMVEIGEERERAKRDVGLFQSGYFIHKGLAFA